MSALGTDEAMEMRVQAHRGLLRPTRALLVALALTACGGSFFVTAIDLGCELRTQAPLPCPYASRIE